MGALLRSVSASSSCRVHLRSTSAIVTNTSQPLLPGTLHIRYSWLPSRQTGHKARSICSSAQPGSDRWLRSSIPTDGIQTADRHACRTSEPIHRSISEFLRSGVLPANTTRKARAHGIRMIHRRTLRCIFGTTSRVLETRLSKMTVALRGPE
jgi:hypothetical protein